MTARVRDGQTRDSKAETEPEFTSLASMLTEEDQNSAAPLHGSNDVAKQNHRAEDGEELPRCRDDGAGERPEVHDGHEDEGLLEAKE